MANQACISCKSTNIKIISVYKHNWHVCSNCETCFRINKEKYPYDRIPSFIKKRLSRYYELQYLQSDSEISKTFLKDMSLTYDYMVSDQHMEYRKNVLKEVDLFEKHFFSSNNVGVKNKKILDISGGNGYFAKEFEQKYGCDVTHTEFNKKSVDFVKEHFKLKSFVYDLNKDKLCDITADKFDIILLRFCINFSLNLNQLIQYLSHSLNKGGLIVVQGAVIPSVEVFYRWQFADGTYLALYTPDNIVKNFENSGFKTIQNSRGHSIPFNDFDWPFKIKPLRYFLKTFTTTLYKIPAKLRFKSIVNNNIQIMQNFVFTK